MKHKQGCQKNVSCLVYHADGICPGYGVCTCKELKDTTNINIQITPDTTPSPLRNSCCTALIQEILDDIGGDINIVFNDKNTLVSAMATQLAKCHNNALRTVRELLMSKMKK